jgi:hypothetical protein
MQFTYSHDEVFGFEITAVSNKGKQFGNAICSITSHIPNELAEIYHFHQKVTWRKAQTSGKKFSLFS